MQKRQIQAKQDSATDSRTARQSHEEIADWLRDAYAMERGMESSLEKQRDNDELREDLRAQARQHLEETKRHAEMVKTALKSLGTDTSALKTGLGALAQAAKGVGSTFARDERIKDLLDGYSMEHFEIACYTALEAAAEKAGLTQVVELCQTILPEEERMADRLLDALPETVISYLYEVDDRMDTRANRTGP